MKERSIFESRFLESLTQEEINYAARTSKHRRKSDAIAELQRKQQFQLKELQRKEYQESTLLRERQTARRASLVQKHRDQMRRLQARRWS